MAWIRGIVFSIVGGAIGAALWAAIAHFARVESGWVAWIVGVLAGLGMGIGLKERASAFSGVVAAFVAILAIGAGKLGASYSLAQEFVRDAVNQPITDHDLRMRRAHDLAAAWEDEGRVMNWPTRQDEDADLTIADFPREVRNDVESWWASMSPSDRDGHRESIRQEILRDAQAAQAALTVVAFVTSFRPLSIVFVVLAVGSAWRLGAAKGARRDAAPAAVEQERPGWVIPAAPPPSTAKPVHPAIRTGGMRPTAPSSEPPSVATQSPSPTNAASDAPSPGGLPGMPPPSTGARKAA